jgi:hypothetical protein
MLLNVPSSAGRFVIHAGDGFYGMAKLPQDQSTLIHELTHVWQGQHESAAFYAAIGLLTQLGSDPYAYNHDHLYSDWDLYNMEQQAQLVEDWFTDGLKEYNPDTGEGDKRFYFIKAIIRGEKVNFNWLSPSIQPLPGATLAHDWSQEPEAIRARHNAVLLPILKRRFAKEDLVGAGARIKKLEQIVSEMTGLEAADLLHRLQARRPSDEVARDFLATFLTRVRVHLWRF